MSGSELSIADLEGLAGVPVFKEVLDLRSEKTCGEEKSQILGNPAAARLVMG